MNSEILLKKAVGAIGFIQDEWGSEIVYCLTDLNSSLRTARQFSVQKPSKRLLKSFPHEVLKKSALIQKKIINQSVYHHRSLGCLETLAFVAEAAQNDWIILVEKNAFSNHYLNNFFNLDNVEALKLHEIPSYLRTFQKEKVNKPLVIITFLDRLMVSSYGCSLVEGHIGRYHISHAEGLISDLPHVTPLTQITSNCPIIKNPTIPVDADQVVREVVYQSYRQIECMLQNSPSTYLAWDQLSSRSEMYQSKLKENMKNFVRSYLLHAKHHSLVNFDSSIFSRLL